MANNTERIINHQDALDMVEQLKGIKGALLLGAAAGKSGSDLEVNDVPTFARLLAMGAGTGFASIGKQFLVPKETAVNVTTSDNNLSVSVDEDTFIAAEHTVAGHIYEFIYDGAVWHDEHGEDVSLTAYGISVTGTPVEGDKIVVTETASNMAFDLVQYNPTGYEYPYDSTGKGDYAMLLAHKIHSYGSVPFCPAQLLLYCEQSLPAGKYKFTLYKATYGGGSQYDGTYVFTTTQAIPAYGGLKLIEFLNII